VHFLFIGDGPRRVEVEREAARHRLPRFQYLDYFPREELARSLSIGDLHLLTLRQDMAGLVAPSKLYGSMAAGRPVLMVGPKASDPAAVILKEEVGVVFDPGMLEDPAQRLAAEILRLRDDAARRKILARRARQAFVERHDRSVRCSAWAELLSTVLDRHVPGSGASVVRGDHESYVGGAPVTSA